MRYELEVGARTVEDVLAAEQGGADRAELYSSPMEGALTPSAGLVAEAAAVRNTLALFVMVRPRAGNFYYSDLEFRTLQRDVDIALSHGADGIMFGILNAEGRLDMPRMKLVARQCGSAAYTLHRAFDFTPDPFETLEQAIDVGCRFVLTLGQEHEAMFSMDTLRTLVKRAGHRIGVQIALGADFRTNDLPVVVNACGARHYHIVNGFRVRPSPQRPGRNKESHSDYLRQTLSSEEYLCATAVREARLVLDTIETKGE